jgi:peroxiredoxin
MQNTFVQRHWIQFSLFVLGAGLVWIGLTAGWAPSPTQGQTPAPRQDFMAPVFELTALDNTQYNLQDLKGKVVVLNIWTTWCTFCKAEMAAFQSVYESYSTRPDLLILGVNSTLQDDPLAVEKFVTQNGLKFPILLDSNGRVTRIYQIQALPTTFFIDRQGIIRNVTLGGPLTEAMIRTQISALLDQVP